MKGFNRAIIAGNLTRDPEVRYTVNKKAYARFGVAVNNSWKNANGELQESTEYINVVVWGPMAENCGKFLKKGRAVLVEGSIRTTSYDAKDGSGKRYTTGINADNVVFLGGKDGGSDSDKEKSSRISPYDMPAPSEEEFGSSIGEGGGFGGFSQDFAKNNRSIPDNFDGTSIPF